MSEEKIATTYKEYKNGAKQVAGLGRLGCYQGLYYLNELLENDKYYSEYLEASTVMIESYINRIEKENKELKNQLEIAKSKLTTMFANGDEDKLLDALLELGKILEVE